jgi:hypothetical protein
MIKVIWLHFYLLFFIGTWTVVDVIIIMIINGTTRPVKGIDRPFRRGVESILIQSLLVNWRLGYFFNLILKGLLHNISKKPLDAA